MKHTPVVQFQAFFSHFLKNTYFKSPGGTKRVNWANIFNLCKRPNLLWGQQYSDIKKKDYQGNFCEEYTTNINEASGSYNKKWSEC